MKHVKAFTYEPKIPAVRQGLCCQTIRPEGKRPVEKGDTILFHGWEGQPYKSSWSWRLEVKVRQVVRIQLRDGGVYFKDTKRLLPWEGCNHIAQRDGFMNGEAMGQWFKEH